MPVTSLPPAHDTELSLSVERAYRESLVTDRLGAIWSLIMAKCFLAQWAILTFAIPVSGPLYIWTLTLIMGVVASLYYLHAHRVKLYLLPTHFRVNAAVLAGLLVALGFVAYAFFALRLLPAPLAAALAAVLLGSWSLARAALRRAWPPLVGAFLWWGLAATALRAPAEQALLWLGLGLLCAQALPGFAVAARASRQRV
ncbi:MAG: hypothetical protein RJA95_807 [Verrucomicrobiota bacterium]|jgi:hypothetical protein